jgi:quinol monooxygenase YgiN
MFVVTAKLQVKPEAREQFVQLLSSHVRQSRGEGRCATFDVCNSADSDLVFLYHEEYPNPELFEQHINSERVQTHLRRTSGMIDGDVWFAKWIRISDAW